MFLINLFCSGDISFVPAFPAGYLAANKQNGGSAGIKDIQDSIGFAVVLNSQFSEYVVPGSRCPIASFVVIAYLHRACCCGLRGWG